MRDRRCTRQALFLEIETQSHDPFPEACEIPRWVSLFAIAVCNRCLQGGSSVDYCT